VAWQCRMQPCARPVAIIGVREYAQELEALADIDEGRTALVGCSSSSVLAPLLCNGAAVPKSLRRAQAQGPLPGGAQSIRWLT